MPSSRSLAAAAVAFTVLAIAFWPQQSSTALLFHQGVSYVVGCPAIEDKGVDMDQLRRKYKFCEQRQPTIPTHYCQKGTAGQEATTAPYWDECAKDCWRNAVPGLANAEFVPC